MRANNVLTLRIALAGLLVTPLAADDDIEKKPIPAVRMDDGAAMYKAYCASCHGIDGKGHGPAEAGLKILPGNLTKLALQNGGPFPSLSVITTLRAGGGAHGNRDMPVWGQVFRESWQSETEVTFRIYNLMRYLDSIQDPPSTVVRKEHKELAPTLRGVRPDLGGEMYRAYCSSCHGVDGRGAGPAATGMKTPPTDLTRLRDANGKFPMLKMQNILTNPSIASHGSKDMPVWGELFLTSGEDRALTHLRMTNLSRYLESIQR